MKITENRFGEGILYSISDVISPRSRPGAKIYCECSACMSVYTDMKSFLSGGGAMLREFFSKTNCADVTDIIVLGCQVTDLAILNDIRTAERLHEENPGATVYMGGCLAQRFDIRLPDFVRRLDVVRDETIALQPICKDYVIWQKPFWITDKLGSGDYDNGNLFRNSTPIKIGAGCHGKCKYCTIRDTRGDNYAADAYLQIAEFLNAKGDVVFVSDSPTVQQVEDWCHIAIRYSKPVSFRNLEPTTANACSGALIELAKRGLLKTLHAPIQSDDFKILKAMNRDVDATKNYIEWSQVLRKYGTKLATNIIIDYKVGNETCRNLNLEFLNNHFDYFAWNPYFDGNWDRNKAEARFKKYIEENDVDLNTPVGEGK